jgi:uncharacterized protein (TIGR03435 family)
VVGIALEGGVTRGAVVGALVVAASILVQASTQDTPSSQEPRFEVASVKPSPPDTAFDCKPPTCSTSFYQTFPGRFRATQMSVVELVSAAYSMPMNRVVGPDWAGSARYDVIATHILPASDQSGWRVMLKHLLEERFSLRLHREERSLPVYVMKKARADDKLGPQLLSIKDCGDPPKIVRVDLSCGVAGFPSATKRIARGRWEAIGLSGLLTYPVGRPVVDETGLSGWFEMSLEWSNSVTGASSQGAAPDPSDRPEIFTAVREQLGLKLEAAERPLEVLVIDSVQQPTEN